MRDLPQINPTPEKLSTLRFPDWIGNDLREAKRAEAAENLYNKMLGYADDPEFPAQSEAEKELDDLLEENEYIDP